MRTQHFPKTGLFTSQRGQGTARLPDSSVSAAAKSKQAGRQSFFFFPSFWETREREAGATAAATTTLPVLCNSAQTPAGAAMGLSRRRVGSVGGVAEGGREREIETSSQKAAAAQISTLRNSGDRKQGDAESLSPP